MISRRNLLTGLAASIAAPYVVRASGVLMPVRRRLDAGTFSGPITVDLLRNAKAMLDANERVAEYIRSAGPVFEPYLGWRIRFGDDGMLYHEPIAA